MIVELTDGERTRNGAARLLLRVALTMQLSDFSPAPLPAPLDLLFIHHSIGAQLLADEGTDDGTGTRHPNGGGLRKQLTTNNYRVHHATYGSRLGERTDLFDWFPKFRDEMPRILRTAKQDEEHAAPRRNRVVVFKSCFPNSAFVSEGAHPGSPLGPSLTLSNAKATLRALLPFFERQPDTLFVFVTTPPLVQHVPSDPVIKRVARKILGRASPRARRERAGVISRAFADWAAAPTGWLERYRMRNVIAFPYHAHLSGGAEFLAFPTGGGTDNHPSAVGNRHAADAFVPLLNRAVRRAAIAGG